MVCFFFLYFFSTRFSYSCAASACACGQTGNHSDSGLIDNKLKLKYRQTPAHISPSAVRSIKNDTVTTFNEHKSKAARTKTNSAYAASAASAGGEPIYVNRMQNQSNYNINNNHVNGIQSERDYYNVLVENDDDGECDDDTDHNVKFEDLINGSKVKTKTLMGKPPLGEKHLRSFFGLSLDEREMPITRERSKLSQTGGGSGSGGGGGNSSSKRTTFGSDAKKLNKSNVSPKLLRASTYDAYPNRAKNR